MMDMQSRNQYLVELRTEYLKNKSRKARSSLLTEAEKRTQLNRKYLMDKLKPKSNLDKLVSEKKKREQYYDNSVKTALIKQGRATRFCGKKCTRTEARSLSMIICTDIPLELN